MIKAPQSVLDVSAEWRRFLWGYAAGSFPVFVYCVYGISKWMDLDKDL